MSLRERTKMTESKMAELKMAAIIKLRQNEQVRFFLWKMAESRMSRIENGCNKSSWVRMHESSIFVQMGTNLGKCQWVWEKELRWLNPRCRIQDGCHHQIEWEEKFIWWKMAESRMTELKMAAIIKFRMHEWSFFCANGRIHNGRIQDGCHH